MKKWSTQEQSTTFASSGWCKASSLHKLKILKYEIHPYSVGILQRLTGKHFQWYFCRFRCQHLNLSDSTIDFELPSVWTTNSWHQSVTPGINPGYSSPSAVWLADSESKRTPQQTKNPRHIKLGLPKPIMMLSKIADLARMNSWRPFKCMNIQHV